ncbi:hypothetical protein D3C86_1754660 [compost metagenome]
MRESVDLPEPEGPITPSAFPALTTKPRPVTVGFLSPGGTMVTFSTRNSFSGFGSAMAAALAGICAKSSLSRAQLWRAATKDFQLEMARSTGAKARPIMIELAIITPPEASC